MSRPSLVIAAALLCVATACSTPDDDGTTAKSTTPDSPVERTAPAATPTPEGKAPDLPDPLADAVADVPRSARTPEELVAQIVAAEDAIADPATPPEVLAAAGHLQQVAYRVLGAKPRWDAPVRKALPPRYHLLVADNVDARREFRSMHRRLGDTLPAWRIVAPAPAAELKRYYRKAEREFGVEWEYLAAINLVETAMGRIRGTSVAGAQGPMQFIPTTWAAYGKGDINSPHDAIMAAARYLEARGFTDRGGVARALYAYNNSRRYVRGVTQLAEIMKRRPRAYLGYYHWQVYFLTDAGGVLLPVGYHQERPVPVRRWLADHPQR